MQRWGAAGLVLTGLLTGGLFASGVTPAGARPHKPPKSTLTVRVAPTTVPVGEPATLTARLRPAAKAHLVVQRRVSGRWVTLARPTTGSDGVARLRISTSVAGVQKLRVLRKSSHPRRRATSHPVTLTVATTARCTPRTALVDPQATTAARCLAARLDRWQSARAMGIGQQLNVSNNAYLAPLTALGDRTVPVVGFDLEELSLGQTYSFPVAPMDALVAQAQRGAVLSASWHAKNPWTGGAYNQPRPAPLEDLLGNNSAATMFWGDFDAKMGLLQQLQAQDVAVVFRPLHEANGDWFWWAHPAPSTYRALWTAMQTRASDLGVHNVLWAYSFNADTGTNTGSPVTLLPTKVDLAGLDAYDPESGTGQGADHLPTTGYAAVAAKVHRMAFTEAGPYDSSDGAWNPAVIARTARTLANPPVFSLLWFDDGTGKKQLASLAGGTTWLDSCRGGFCSVG